MPGMHTIWRRLTLHVHPFIALHGLLLLCVIPLCSKASSNDPRNASGEVGEVTSAYKTRTGESKRHGDTVW